MFLCHMKPISLMLHLHASWPTCLHILLLFTLNSLLFTTASASSNETDHFALLKFKEAISSDPYGILDSWNSSTHFCKWHGVTCSPLNQRVTELNLQGYRLQGPISPQVGNLSSLINLNLQNNSFYGTIPQELGHLYQLQLLWLNNNSLVGEIPSNLTGWSNLKGLYLFVNNLVGSIPIGIGSLRKLQELLFWRNNLTEQIPPSVGNLSYLSYLNLGSNNLEGNIPQEVCRLKNMGWMSLGINKLSGKPPFCLYNMSSLTLLSIPVNQFNGSLPPEMFQTLPNLQTLFIGGNQFSGQIPASITNASSLQSFDNTINHFKGQVPSLKKLKNLWLLGLAYNNLGGNSTTDLEFLNSLTNCSELYVIDISYNNFGGHLPNSLGNMSNKFNYLYLGGNHISGKIPTELGNLINLFLFTIEDNRLEGIIPATFGKLQKMQVLELSGNQFSGNIPTFIGNLSQLSFLGLAQNRFEGNIPPSIENCKNLQSLNLSQNNLSGNIPSEVFSLFSLTKLLDLSQNSLSGSLGEEVGRLKNINKLNVSENHLSGDIPPTIGGCTSLEYLDLQGNAFNGSIPSSLASLKGLVHLDLSRNRLSGSIPEGLQNMAFLEYFNVSFNNLEGEIPTKGVFGNASEVVVTGNNNLCGGISKLHLPPCPAKGNKHAKHHNSRLIAVIVSVVAFLLILSLILSILWMRTRNKKTLPDSPTIDQLAMVSYQNLHNGTEGFSSRCLIGSGNFGSVYKGTLESEERAVAIKVLNLQKKGAHKSFIAECNALKNIRHRNLVKNLTCCSSTDYKGQEFKALVFEYMTNGSLESWLHPETPDQPKSLNLEKRFNIILDVASAFHYLHYECEQPVIHCDLKPSNVLLDDSMVAHVSDFGLAKLLPCIGVSQMQNSTGGIKGTIGYAPPEYGMGSEVSIEGDMFSFGILVLEMLTGKSPTDEMFKDGHNLHNYVELSISESLMQIVDPIILQNEFNQATEDGNLGIVQLQPNAEKCLLSLLRIALACSMESPKERMSMIDVIRELNLIKRFFPTVARQRQIA
ncbi:probable LRR receptor-like serine/threonine-protein kinase At3g47570 [Lotus japonicus]|uniref:probable LRR receptor-like serine/threonine-protein kinase At3g47570 n=1 Tax=Lotus japonicus TaxID=34305 RepID=UPI00258CBFE0|nr:probable LRR receptor-like serine/threonine-protein kinase At3g47570 [Lotus japonicus]